MKLLAGALLFLLCGLVGEGKARCLARRERSLKDLHGLIEKIGDWQLSGLVSFREGALRCPPSPEQEQLLTLAQGKEADMLLLTAEERSSLAAYVRSDSRSLEALRAQRNELLALLREAQERTRQELSRKGQVYRSVGYLCGAAALLLVL